MSESLGCARIKQSIPWHGEALRRRQYPASSIQHPVSRIKAPRAAPQARPTLPHHRLHHLRRLQNKPLK